MFCDAEFEKKLKSFLGFKDAMTTFKWKAGQGLLIFCFRNRARVQHFGSGHLDHAIWPLFSFVQDCDDPFHA
jgi:hypothetical protein